MHVWCMPGQRDCVLAVLVAELRSDRQAEETAPLPSLVHDLWLLILEFVPQCELGRPLDVTHLQPNRCQYVYYMSNKLSFFGPT